ncbi:hypothetical protein NL676_027382 [Syzygium grande]|nr:hypothetical protein NL676_027382 [Syzygium grande]
MAGVGGPMDWRSSSLLWPNLSVRFPNEGILPSRSPFPSPPVNIPSSLLVPGSSSELNGTTDLEFRLSRDGYGLEPFPSNRFHPLCLLARRDVDMLLNHGRATGALLRR